MLGAHMGSDTRSHAGTDLALPTRISAGIDAAGWLPVAVVAAAAVAVATTLALAVAVVVAAVVAFLLPVGTRMTTAFLTAL